MEVPLEEFIRTNSWDFAKVRLYAKARSKECCYPEYQSDAQ